MKYPPMIFLSSFSSITKKLLIALGILLFLSCSIGLLEYLLYPLERGIPLIVYPKMFFSLKLSGSDAWGPMGIAFDHLKSSSPDSIYDKIFFGKITKFQYPLSSLLLYIPFRIIAQENIINCLNFISWISILATVYFVVKIFNKSCLDSGVEVENSSKKNQIFQSLLLFSLSLIFYPIMRAFGIGQIQVWINALFTISVWCWITNRKRETGFLVGVMCLIKPQYSLIFVWALFRKQWGFVKAFTVTVFIGTSLSFLLFGVKNNLDYLKVLSFISRHGESFHANQSINGILNRLLFNGDNLGFSHNSFPPFNIWVYTGTILTSLILVFYSLFRRVKTFSKGNTLDFFIICITATIASPVAWEHHYGITLGIYAFLFPPLLKTQNLSKPLLYLGISYMLSSQYFPIINRLTYNTLLNLLQSYLFFGGLMLLAYLYWIEICQTKSENALISNQNNQ